MKKIAKVQCYSGAIRTTIPMVIAKYLEVKAGDCIQFTVLKNGSVTITKAKEQN